MSKYFVFQVPYRENESAFLLDAMHMAAKAYREFHERSTEAMDSLTYPLADDASYLLITEETDDHRPTSAQVSGLIF